MSASDPKRCRSCGADIYWLRHLYTGKMAPIDAATDAAGTIMMHHDRGTYENVPKDGREAQGGWLHTNHFQTCPQSADWKKRGSVRETGAAR